MFSLSQIDQLFSENIHKCLNGSEHYRHMEYVNGQIHDGKCPKGSLGNVNSFCDVALKISGLDPILSEPYLLPNQVFFQSVTSVYFQELEGSGSGVLIAGTASGRVLVFLISGTSGAKLLSNSGAKLLTNYQLQERSAVSKVHLINNDIIALQLHTLTKLRASNCENSYKTCQTCIKSNDPFCGWCSFRNKCTHLSDCKPHRIFDLKQKNVGQWLSKSPRQCSRVEGIIPSSISLPTAVIAATTSLSDQTSITALSSTHISIYIASLPELPLGENFVCVFGNVSVSKAKIIQKGLQCQIPTSREFNLHVMQEQRHKVHEEEREETYHPGL